MQSKNYNPGYDYPKLDQKEGVKPLIPFGDLEYVSEFSMSSLDFYSIHWFRTEVQKAMMEMFVDTNIPMLHRVLIAAKNMYYPIMPLKHPPLDPRTHLPMPDPIKEKIREGWKKYEKLLEEKNMGGRVSYQSKKEFYFLMDDIMELIYWARQYHNIGIKGTPFKQYNPYRKEERDDSV